MPLDDEIIELIEREAQARADVHKDNPRGIVPDRDKLGLLGEVEFARVFRQPIDLERKRRGDKGIDFIVPWRCTIDVKCSRIPVLFW